MSVQWSPRDDDRWDASLADELIAFGVDLGARRGHMFGHPALYAGRRLAACAYADGIGIKLPAERVDVLIHSGRATAFQPYGKARMREWVHVRVAGGDGVADVADLITESLEFAAQAPDDAPAR